MRAVHDHIASLMAEADVERSWPEWPAAPAPAPRTRPASAGRASTGGTGRARRRPARRMRHLSRTVPWRRAAHEARPPASIATRADRRRASLGRPDRRHTGRPVAILGARDDPSITPPARSPSGRPGLDRPRDHGDRTSGGQCPLAVRPLQIAAASRGVSRGRSDRGRAVVRDRAGAPAGAADARPAPDARLDGPALASSSACAPSVCSPGSGSWSRPSSARPSRTPTSRHSSCGPMAGSSCRTSAR